MKPRGTGKESTMIVGVIGSGSIGPDLAYGFVSALARAGGKVYLHDIVKEALDAGVARIEGYVGKSVARGRMSSKAAETTRGALVPTLDIQDLANCDYVLEAATENLATNWKKWCARIVLSDLPHPEFQERRSRQKLFTLNAAL